MALVCIHFICMFYIRNQFLEEIVFIFPMWGIKPYHIVFVSLWTHNHHLGGQFIIYKAVGHILQTAFPNPVRITAAATMKKIQHRICIRSRFIVTWWQIYGIFALRYAL